MNKEFQELKRLWGVNVQERQSIIERMRENLIARNGGEFKYAFGYIKKNEIVDLGELETASQLFEVDGDMSPQGI